MELNSSWGGLPVTDDIFNVTSPSTEAKLLSDPDWSTAVLSSPPLRPFFQSTGLFLGGTSSSWIRVGWWQEVFRWALHVFHVWYRILELSLLAAILLCCHQRRMAPPQFDSTTALSVVSRSTGMHPLLVGNFPLAASLPGLQTPAVSGFSRETILSNPCIQPSQAEYRPTSISCPFHRTRLFDISDLNFILLVPNRIFIDLLHYAGMLKAAQHHWNSFWTDTFSLQKVVWRLKAR